MSRLNGLPKNIGERNIKIAVAKAVARHLMMASASIEHGQHPSKYQFCKAMSRTLVYSVDSKTDKNVVDNDHDCSKAVISFKEGWLVFVHDLDQDVAHQITGCAGAIEKDVVGMQAGVLGLKKCLIYDARYRAEKHLEQQEYVYSERISGADFWIVLSHY